MGFMGLLLCRHEACLQHQETNVKGRSCFPPKTSNAPINVFKINYNMSKWFNSSIFFVLLRVRVGYFRRLMKYLHSSIHTGYEGYPGYFNTVCHGGARVTKGVLHFNVLETITVVLGPSR